MPIPTSETERLLIDRLAAAEYQRDQYAMINRALGALLFAVIICMMWGAA